MYSNLGVQRYRETDIASMSSEKMIVLLYERIAVDLKAARAAIESGNRIEMAKQVNHAQRIISELRSALDHSIGGEISQNLDSLYDFMFHQTLDVLVDQDPKHLDNCLEVLTPLLDAWRQIPCGTGEKAAQDLASGKNPEGGPENASAEGKGDREGAPGPGNDPARQKTSLLSVSA
jgi:flagellar protein FliS